jgi:hypothetical protein
LFFCIQIIENGHKLHKELYEQGDQERGKMPEFLKSSQNSCQFKNVKISRSKLNLKVKNIYSLALFKYILQTMFDAAYLGENVTNCLSKN